MLAGVSALPKLVRIGTNQGFAEPPSERLRRWRGLVDPHASIPTLVQDVNLHWSGFRARLLPPDGGRRGVAMRRACLALQGCRGLAGRSSDVQAGAKLAETPAHRRQQPIPLRNSRLCRAGDRKFSAIVKACDIRRVMNETASRHLDAVRRHRRSGRARGKEPFDRSC